MSINEYFTLMSNTRSIILSKLQHSQQKYAGEDSLRCLGTEVDRTAVDNDGAVAYDTKLLGAVQKNN